MGYFDGLTDASFKDAPDGETFFYPWGALGKGYILPDNQAKQRMRNFIKRHYIVALPFMIGTGIIFGWLYAIALLPIYIICYVIAINKRIKGLNRTDVKMSMKEGMRNSAKSHNAITLWLMLIASIGFVILSLKGLTDLPPNNDGLLVFILGLFIFGACAVTFAYMIKSRKKATGR